VKGQKMGRKEKERKNGFFNLKKYITFFVFFQNFGNLRRNKKSG